MGLKESGLRGSIRNVSTGIGAAITIDTLEAEDVGEDSATIRGEITELTNFAEDAEVFFEWGEITEGLPNTTDIQLQDTVGVFTEDLTNLSEDTTHEFQAFGSVRDVSDEGVVLTFETDAAIPDSVVLDDWADDQSGFSSAIDSRDEFDTFDYQESYEDKFNPSGSRPNWDVNIDDDGNVSVEGDRVVMGGDSNIQTSTTQTVGIWEFDFEWTATRDGSNDSDRVNFDLVIGGSENLRVLVRRHNGSIEVRTPTDSITWSWDGDTDEHSIKLVSDNEGNYEAFFDGVSQGETTDTTEPDGDNLRIRAVDNNNEVRINRIEIYPNE